VVDAADDGEGVGVAGDVRHPLGQQHAGDARAERFVEAAHLVGGVRLGVERLALVDAADLKEDDAGAGLCRPALLRRGQGARPPLYSWGTFSGTIPSCAVWWSLRKPP